SFLISRFGGRLQAAAAGLKVAADPSLRSRRALRAIVWAGSAVAAVAIIVAAGLLWRGVPTRPPARGAGAPSAARAAATPRAAKTATKVTAIPPSFDIVSVAPDGQAVIAGRAMPGDRVTVLDSNKPIGEVTADARGEWVLLPDKKLAPGTSQLTLAAVGPHGGPTLRSNDVVALTVKPATAGGSATALAVLLPGEPGQPARILQQSPRPVGATLTLDSVEYGAGDRLVLAGHADPGARLQVFAGERLLGVAEADGAGHWQLVTKRPTGSGRIDLRLAEIGGGIAQALAAPVAVPAADGPAENGTYVVERGNSLWRIARRVYGNGLHYTEIYRANRDEISNPNLIYPGQHFTVPKS
ncbi:MAG TPA: LysM peptidoglycan-binding domain-containing protein, partial [Stellaceae bacterium]|nr:LysM peptidoglycan-binding domain-containing protein [Stellaceae bacterium]